MATEAPAEVPTRTAAVEAAGDTMTAEDIHTTPLLPLLPTTTRPLLRRPQLARRVTAAVVASSTG